MSDYIGHVRPRETKNTPTVVMGLPRLTQLEKFQLLDLFKATKDRNEFLAKAKAFNAGHDMDSLKDIHETFLISTPQS